MAGEVKQILEYAINNGFLTREQVEECAKIKAAVNEAGLHRTLIQVLCEKNYLSRKQLSKIKVKLDLPIAEIGNYGILSKLGVGGMGAVYKARRLADGETVAVKLLAEHIKDESHIERFRREITAGIELAHPNIVSVIDSGIERNKYFYVMEYVEGRNLDEILKKDGVIPEPEAVGIVMRVADALDYAYKRGIIHRDIKPANIIISNDGIPKLCDFGIAKFTSDEYTALTQADVSVGTPEYVSPEQAGCESNIDVRSDLYSLGITLYQMVTGKTPFGGKDTRDILSSHVNKVPQSPQKLNPKVSDWLSGVIMKLLEKSPSKRYQSPADLIADMKEAKHKPRAHDELRKYLRSKTARSKTPLQYTSRRFQSVRSFILVTVASIVIVCGVLALTFGAMYYPKTRRGGAYYIKEGNKKYDAGDYYGAIVDYYRAIELNSNSAEAYSKRGIAKDALGDLKSAVEDWEKATDINPAYRTQLQPYIDAAKKRMKNER